LMFRWPPEVPQGYSAEIVQGVGLIALTPFRLSLAECLSSGTLYQYAANHPDKRALGGRGEAYAISLRDGTHIVVRHNQHGGVLAPLTGDTFLLPTRA